MVDRRVTVHKKALPDGRLRLSFEHSPLLSRDFGVDEWHHLATISNRKSSARGGPWTPRFEELFEQVGMSLSDSANLVHIQGHEGPHSEQYHRTVYGRLLAALRKCKSLDECRGAFTNELKNIADALCTPGSDLNKMLIKKAQP